MTDGAHGAERGPATSQVVVSHEPAATVVTLHGEVDVAIDAHLTAVGAQLATLDQPVVVDLGAVTFMDSVGVRFLVRLTTGSAPSVALRAVPPAVREVLVLVGAARLFALPD